MNNIFRIIIVLAIVCTQIQGQKTKEFKTNEVFDRYFEKDKDIAFSDNILIGAINAIASFGDNILVVDPISKKAFVMTHSGKIIKTLNPEECNPGVQWKPYEGYVNKNGKIYIMNPPGGFMFGKNGECIKPMNASFFSTQSLCFLSNGNIVGYYLMGKNRNYLKLMNEQGKEIKKFVDFPKEFQYLENIWREGGVVSDKYDNIYLARPSTPEIIKYNKNGSVIGKFRYASPDFRRVTEDLRPNEDRGKGFERVIEGKSHITQIFLLDDNKLLIVAYYKYTKIGMQIYDLEGNKLTSEELIANIKPMYASNGRLYFVFQPPITKNNDIPNPIIKVFKLKAR